MKKNPVGVVIINSEGAFFYFNCIGRSKNYKSLKNYEIISVFAGKRFSFFITSEKKILICGINSYAKCEEPAFEPIILDIPNCDSFYVTGKFASSPIFINCELPNSPERPTKYKQ